ncbi:MAG: ABC transporter permease [Xanthomonadales bacterium]|jgi:ABC-2 type transport system permease protein|nr:ABC transporter permease [Xanthomonadales bacterium]
MPFAAPRFADVLAVEAYKLRRSLALALALIAPTLVAVFVFFNLLRQDDPAPWQMSVQASAGIWAFFMLPMSMTALTALVAHTEHGPRAWEVLYALPRPRWHWPAAKALLVLAVLALMSVALAVITLAAIEAAAWWKPAVAPSGARDLAGYLGLLLRIGLSATLLVAVQLWVALRYVSFVPALALGIGGTFFAVVATSAKVGVLMPWQIPVNQLASDPDRALLALAIGLLGGGLVLIAMCTDLARREMS